MSRSSERVIPRAATPSFVRRVAVGEQLIAIVSPLLLIALWEALVRIRILDARFFPAPSSIVGTFTSLIASGELLLHVGASLKRVLLGLLVAGVLNIQPIFLDVGRNFGASRLQVFRTIALPGALPLIFAGLRLGLGIALILIVIAEIVGARSGIGYMIWQAWTIFQVERMYVGLVVIAVLGWLAALIIDAVERVLIPWRPRR